MQRGHVLMLFLAQNFEAQLRVRACVATFKIIGRVKKLVSQVCLFQNDTCRAVRCRSRTNYVASKNFFREFSIGG